MASLTKIGSLILGPYAPAQFEAGTVNALIRTGIQAVSDASGTSAVQDCQIVNVLGNYYVHVLYTLA